MSSRNRKVKTGYCYIYYNGKPSKNFPHVNVEDRRRKIEKAINSAKNLTGDICIVICPDVIIT